MAKPVCPKCGSGKFEMTTIDPEGAYFKINVINCASCGTVVGTADYNDIAGILKKIGDKLGVSVKL